MRGIPVVVGLRRTVGDPRTSSSSCRKHPGTRRASRKTLSPLGNRFDLLPRAWRDRMAATALGVPSPGHRVGDLRPLDRSGVWQRIHDALRDRTRMRDGRNPLPSAAIIDSQSVQGSDTVPPVQPRVRRGQENQRPQTSHRGRHQRLAARCRGDHRGYLG